MDAHIFRRIAAELAPRLAGSRVHKIYSLAPETLLFVFAAKNEGAPGKFYLIFDHSRANPALLAVPEKPQTPEQPTAEAMRLRKYIQGRHVRALHSHWPHRALTLDFSNPAGTEPLLLILNLAPPPGRPAVILHQTPGLEFESEPAWPAPDRLPDMLADDSAWRDFPVLTPLLRKTLALLPPPDQAALLADLRAGNGDIFVYEEVGEGDAIAPPQLTAWPLPEPLRRGRTERVFAFAPDAALAAAQYCHAPRAMDSLNRPLRADLRQEAARARKRGARLAARLDEEELKLRAWCAKKADGLLLQAHLHAFAKDFRADFVILDGFGESGGPSGPEGPGKSVRVDLDPLLSLRENMARFFHLAAKGQRGLAHLARRREELSRRATELERGGTELDAALASGAAQSPLRPTLAVDRAKGKKGATPSGKAASGHKDITCFKSSDGFVILRGRNANGNRALLKIASPHDYWFHAKDGPSAHTVLRRAHALVEAPEAGLLEAAGLTALKSAWKNDSRAEIIMALVRDVRPLPGGAPGQVLVDKILRTLVVRPDAELEKLAEEN